MSYFVLGIAFIAGFLLLGRWATSANPRVLAWIVRIMIGVFGLMVIGFIAFSGRFIWMAYALPFLLPVFFQWKSRRIRARNAAGPSRGQTSDVSTAYLHVTLDHDSGEMIGRVITGPYAGRELSTLALAELLDLLDRSVDDVDSVRVLETYLDREHGAEWRDAAGDGRGQAGNGSMTRDEAYEILGLEVGAGAEDIRAAHRRLMAKMHPDRGGSTYLAAKLNQAKDMLLGD